MRRLPKETSQIPNNIFPTLYSGSQRRQKDKQEHAYGQWVPFPSSDSVALAEKLQEMYWSAIHREIKHIILTLMEWERSNVVLDEEKELEELENEEKDEDDDLFATPKGIHGFDTFLDQVSGEARDFAVRYKQLRDNGAAGISFEKILADRIKTDVHYANSIRLKDRVKESIRSIERQKEARDKRRARLLLQSVGFLDIDKLIEYREPIFLGIPYVRFWSRGRTPQVRFAGVDDDGHPKFEAEKCALCYSIIRGIMFAKTGVLGEAKEFICEDCFRIASANRDPSASGFLKFYKHSVLDEKVITKEVSWKICKCTGVSRTDEDGNQVGLFPIDLDTPHRGSAKDVEIRKNSQPNVSSFSGGGLSCLLLQLNGMVAEAKFGSLATEVEKRKTLERLRKETEAQMWAMEMEERMGSSPRAYSTQKRGAPNPYYINSEKVNSVKEAGAAMDIGRAGVDEEDMPFFLKKITGRYPFGNVHMSLMIGPLIVENGVPHTNGGVVITIRPPGQLGVSYETSESGGIFEDCVSISEQRRCFVEKRKLHQRRLKACMKQIVGGVFCKGGYINPTLEKEIVMELVTQARNNFPDPRKTEKFIEKKLEESTGKIVEKLRVLLDSHVQLRMNQISQKLFSPAVKLRWSYRSNNCQNFCDNLLDWSQFGPLLANPSQEARNTNLSNNNASPTYLFSFVSRSGSYTRADVKTKFDVPNGITEEYILKFRYGTHDDADIVDTLHEYWHDWGSFGGHLYKHQELFPWDCTEAYGKYPTRCNECNLAKHVWSFPFDSWSIIQLHLAKGRQFYPPCPSEPDKHMHDKAWMKNRLTLLLAQDALSCGALGMMRSPMFRAASLWLATQPDPQLDRVKLGGIHRAQPFGHQFEKGKYHEYLVAHWAHWKRDLQIKEYERLRDARVKLPDINLTLKSNVDHGGCGGCDAGVLCGVAGSCSDAGGTGGGSGDASGGCDGGGGGGGNGAGGGGGGCGGCGGGGGDG